MRTKLILAALAASVLFASASSAQTPTPATAPVQSPSDPVGENYFITLYRGVPETPDSKHATWKGKEYRQVQWLQGSCMEDLGAQFKDTSARVAQLAEARSHGLFTRDRGPEYQEKHQQSIRAAFGDCMRLQVGFAQKYDGQLEGVGVITSHDLVPGNPYAVPTTN